MKWFLPVPALLGGEALANPVDLAGRLLLLLISSSSLVGSHVLLISLFPFCFNITITITFLTF
jgi:hypothetical protein